jgi:calcium-dependent protein kinase
MKTRIGTPYYMAPEVLEGAYDETCDMWSIGVITYCLLCGYPPFNADTDQLLFRKIKLCDYEFHNPEWSEISDEAKQFIQGLLQPNPQLRMTPEQALSHQWIKSTPKEQANKCVLTRLSTFKKPDLF